MGTPIREIVSGVAARFAKRPKRYSVFNSRPSKVRVMSMRPRRSSARREEFMDFAWVWSAG